VAKIAVAFVKQLSLARLSSRDVRIVSAIFNQTIAFNKREDDMNSIRLEQLTDIRDDHAGASVRRLQALNIILTRRGFYGKWLSINYDFRNWGEPCSKSTTNDPSCLLPDNYQDSFDDESFEFKLHTPLDSFSESTKKEQVVVMNKAVSEEEKTVPTVPSDPLPAVVSHVVSKEEKVESTIEEAPLPAVISSPSITQQKPAELHFPQIISEKLRQQIIENIGPHNLTHKMQQLLDYFAECLRSGNVRSPIAYFSDLKKRWINNTLDTNQTPLQTPNQSQREQPYAPEAEKEARRQQIKKRHAYQDAILDFKQTKRVVKMMMEQKNATFEQAIKELNYTQIWEKAVKLLKQTHEAYLPS
jgi:hypothetical protein